MVRDRIRWTIFQVSLVGLQMNSALQISLISTVQILYVVLVVRETRKNAIFKNFGTKIQYICQESAILTFLLVLTLFSFLQGTKFSESRAYHALQTVVVVAVFVAIAAQVISVIWSVFHQISDFLVRRAKKKDQEKLKRVEASLKKATAELRELDVENNPEIISLKSKKQFGANSVPPDNRIEIPQVIELHRDSNNKNNNPSLPEGNQARIKSSDIQPIHEAKQAREANSDDVRIHFCLF